MPTTRARSIVALLLLCALLTGVVPPGKAQSPTSAITLGLIEQPLWHAPGDSLALRFAITNSSPEPLEGFLLRIEGHSRVSSRSALHEAFDGNAGFSISSFPKYYTQVDVGPGATQTVTVREPVSDLTALANAPGGGVFPVTVTLFDADGSSLLDSLTTPVIYYPTPPEIPLGFSLVVPLNDVPNRDPSGRFVSDPSADRVSLEQAVQPQGWLSGLLATLDNATTPPPPPEPAPRRRGRKGRRRAPPPEPQPAALKLALAPTPRLVEEIADLADGYRTQDATRRRDTPGARAAAATLRGLRALTQRDGVQTLLVPYSFPDLPAIADGLAPLDGLIPQFNHARQVMERVLGLDEMGRWIFPPAGRLDAGTLADLKTIDDELTHVIVTEESLQLPEDVAPPGCPEGSPSFVCPVQVQAGGRTVGLLTDEGLQDRFADLVGDEEETLALQNLFAETAMIREEAPGVEGRVVQATVPSLWHPDDVLLGTLMNRLREAPWLRTLTPQQALATTVDAGPRRISAAIPGLAIDDPDIGLFQAITTTQQLVESFRLVRPPQSITQRLGRNLLTAQSRLWGSSAQLTDRADEYVEQTLDETQRELDKITVGGTDEIRLTSQRGEIPIEVFNDTNYPVSVNVRVIAPDLRLDETFPQVLQPGRFQQITVDIAARSSGIFPVEVSVETPDGTHQIDARSITVRSTEFNKVAVVITIGALAFLVLFYLGRGIRRRVPAEAA